MILPRLAMSGVTAAFLAFTGCGGGETDAADDSAPAQGSSAATSAVAPSTPPATAAKAVAASAPAAAAERVAIKDFEYEPADLQVAAGTKVTWTNRDAANHTVTFTADARNLGNQPKGKAVARTFAKAGTYTYFCDYHPSMKGEVVVG